MKKIVISGAALFAVAVLASCVSSKESAYRKAYEKAKAQEEIVEQQPQQQYVQQPVQQYVQQPQYQQQPQQQYVQQPQQQYVQQQPQYQQQPVQQYVQQQPQQQYVQQQPQQQYVQQQPQQQYVQQQPQYQQQVAQQPVANDNVPVRQERLTVVNGAGLKAFSVVVGSFGVKANAEGLQRTLVNSGYCAQVAYNQDRNMYRVIASTYDTKQDAIVSRDNLSANYPGAWLLYNNN